MAHPVLINEMDLILYHRLLDESLLLKDIIQVGQKQVKDMPYLTEGLFFMVYKRLVHFENKTLKPEDLLLDLLYESPTVNRLRLRTMGSTTESYIALKLLSDLLMEKLRGHDAYQALQNLSESINHHTKAKDMNSLAQAPLIQKIRHYLQSQACESLFSESELKQLKEGIKDPKKQKQALPQALALALFEHFNQSDPQWLKPLLDEAQDALKTPGAPRDQGGDTLTDLIEKVVASNQEEQDASLKNMLNEVFQSEEDLKHVDKERVKEAFEKRLKPKLKDLLISGSTGQKPLANQVETLSDDHLVARHLLSDETLTEEEKAKQAPLQIKIISDPQALKEAKENLNRQRQALEDHFSFDTEVETIHESIDAFHDHLQTLGLPQDALTTLSFDEALSLFKRFKTPTFRRFVNKVGRGKIAAKEAGKHKHTEKITPMDQIKMSHALDAMIDDELIALSLDIEAFENDFYDRYLNERLLTVKMVSHKDKRKGPIILCYDGSGSMQGAKIEETQAQILTILDIAKQQKRKMILIQFASKTEALFIKEINPLALTAKDVLSIMDTFICGGTDFEKPLQQAMDFIKEARHKKSDILFITDGQCEIRQSFKSDFLRLKKERQFKLYSIIMHAPTYKDYGDLGDLSDHILDIQANDSSIGHDRINETLYSLI